MLHNSIEHRLETVSIRSSDGMAYAVFIPSRGGTMASLTLLGRQGFRQLLYQHDFFWDQQITELPGAWPFCFPVCARLERDRKPGAYYYDGTVYELPIHGFAWQLPWTVIAVNSHSITLRLNDNEYTRLHYPFSFSIELCYVIESKRLLCYQVYSNRGDKPMPYNAGFHPYFLTPPVGQGKEQVLLDYYPVRRFVYNRQMTCLMGETTLFDVPIRITDPTINEQLTQVTDKEIRLLYPNGDTIQMTAEGEDGTDLFPYVQLYTMSDKPFICVEPWMGYPNAMNSVQGMRWLAPYEQERGILTLQLN